MYHIENLTSEAKEFGNDIFAKEYKTFVIDDKVLEDTYRNYRVIWKSKDDKPKLCSMRCLHFSMNQLKLWTKKLEKSLEKSGKCKVNIPTVFTTAPDVLQKFINEAEYKSLIEMGVIVSSICPSMYMNNPLAKKKAVITSSNKLRTYTTARFYKDDEILELLTKGGK